MTSGLLISLEYTQCSCGQRASFIGQTMWDKQKKTKTKTKTILTLRSCLDGQGQGSHYKGLLGSCVIFCSDKQSGAPQNMSNSCSGEATKAWVSPGTAQRIHQKEAPELPLHLALEAVRLGKNNWQSGCPGSDCQASNGPSSEELVCGCVEAAVKATPFSKHSSMAGIPPLS